MSRCQAFHEIRVFTVNSLKNIVINQLGQPTWNHYLKDWSVILKIFVCMETVVTFEPELDEVKDSVEQLSTNFFFYKIHVRKLQRLVAACSHPTTCI